MNLMVYMRYKPEKSEAVVFQDFVSRMMEIQRQLDA